MHKFLQLISGVILGASLTGCLGNSAEREPMLVVEPRSVVLKAAQHAAGEPVYDTLTIQFNRSWSVGFRDPVDRDKTVDWLQLSMDEAYNYSYSTLTKKAVLAATANESSSPRFCEIVFFIAGGEVAVPVKQEGSE